MTIDLEQFHDIFFQESQEALDSMEQTLLLLNGGGLDQDGINTLFRVAHSIKGGAATFGFTELTSFTHAAETLLDLVRSGKMTISARDVDLLLRSVDIMRELLTAARHKRPPDMGRLLEVQGEFTRCIDECADRGAAGGSRPARIERPAGAATPRMAAAESQGRWLVGFEPGADMLRHGNDPLRLFGELGAVGELTARVDAAALPPLADLDPHVCYLKWSLELQGPVSRDELDRVFDWVGADASILIEAPTAPVQPAGGAPVPMTAEPREASDAAQPPVAADPPRSHAAEASSIRVSIAKLDELIDTVGELVITQSMLSQLTAGLDGHRNEDLKVGLSQLERQMRALQESVMRVRMLPISFVFNRFPRMVRDLGQRLGKRVELRLTGEHTELDKTVLEKIGDPLVHLVRNSIDHGIESPERRLAAGKPETGTIHLDAYHKGGNITVEIRDDGAGLDRDRILAKARERGLVAADEEPSDERIHNLIFQAGFSTAETLSDVSGRGVGMDVVRRNIVELGGTVQVFSTHGQGSTVRIRLPLTLAILDGQLVRVGRETYVIPLVSIVETIQIRREQVSSVAGRAELFRLRDEYIPIIRLYDLFAVEADTTDLSRGLLTIVEADGRRAGILVDELLAQQQVVIKSLETNFRQLAGISGATMLGDGHVALILDVPGLITSFEGDAGGRAISSAA